MKLPAHRPDLLAFVCAVLGHRWRRMKAVRGDLCIRCWAAK